MVKYSSSSLPKPVGPKAREKRILKQLVRWHVRDGEHLVALYGLLRVELWVIRVLELQGGRMMKVRPRWARALAPPRFRPGLSNPGEYLVRGLAHGWPPVGLAWESKRR